MNVVISWFLSYERRLLGRIGLRGGAERDGIALSTLCALGLYRSVQSRSRSNERLGLNGAVGLFLDRAWVLIGRVIRRGPTHVSSKKTIACQRERADNQHPDEQDHRCNKDRDDLCHGGGANDRATRSAGMADNRNRNTPPGQDGIEGRRQKPRAKEIINFLGLVSALFRGEDASDAGKVDPTKRDGQDACPAHPCKRQVTEHISQCELGC